MDFSDHAKPFNQFAPAFASHSTADKGMASLLQKLVLAQLGSLNVTYAPFDHVPTNADLVIVGITPGRVQAINAIAAASNALRAGKDNKEASRLAKLEGSFSGPMRANLVSMLDHIGLNTALRLTTCATIFDPLRERIHFTSALRYPVFVGEENYNGKPDMLRTPLLKSMIDNCLTDEARSLSKAIWLPLGPQASRAVEYLCSKGVLNNKQVLQGLPHPSGANMERIAYFTGLKARDLLSSKTNPDALDAALSKLRLQMLELKSRAA